MAKRLKFINNYQAIAASGVGGFDDHIDVDVVPNLGISDPAAGTYYFPITITDGSGGITQTVCTGWDSVNLQLFIEPLSISDLTGSCTVICSPVNESNMFFQLTQSVSGGLGGDTYAAEHGIFHVVNVGSAGTIEVATLPDTAWSHYEGLAPGGQVTRLLLIDSDADQPVLTWTASYGSLEWEAGAPQFSVGKTKLLVEIVGGVYGSFKSFA